MTTTNQTDSASNVRRRPTPAFSPPEGTEWIRVSPRLAKMRRTELAVLGLLPLLVVTVALSFDEPVAATIVGGVGLVLVLAGWYSIGRNFRSWGYAEQVDDLLVTHGAMFKKLTVVPYGRMQLVDVNAGPIERMFGLVNVKLHTASASSDARVRGLTPTDAGNLRDRLTALGEAHAAGL